MKFLNYKLMIGLLLIIISCSGQTRSIQVKDFKFSSIFGYDLKDRSQIYCLLGNGFIRAPSSKNSDSIIKTWIYNHPTAEVVQIATLNDTKSKMTYCWLVDKTDTINNYLIKNGCFPGGTMLRPQTYAEMSDQMKSVYSSIAKPQINVYIDEKTYDTFIKQIKASEIHAKTNKLGIWSEKDKD